ncbi:hypothetical protein, partial [Candidatus Ichthyocystis sparus]|uniref:hypothetical protein n=1 Tax=Candidatus Ichthyocystis sparus TaxID=1561004 RepID=UPI00159EE86A
SQANGMLRDLENKQKDLELREERTLGIHEIDGILRASTEAFDRAKCELEMETDRAHRCRVTFLAELDKLKNNKETEKPLQELILEMERVEFDMSRMEPNMTARVERNHALTMREQSVSHRERDICRREAELVRREDAINR